MRCIGSGGNGSVYEGKLSVDGRRTAVKRVKARYDGNGYSSNVVKELFFSSSFSHGKIAKSNAIQFSGDYVELTFDLAKMDLHTLIRERKAARKLFTHHEVARILSQVLDALHYMHSLHIMHRDVKPANILIMKTDSLDVCLSDLGLARNCHRVGTGDRWSDYALETSTPGYQAPELLARTSDYDEKVDIWNIGLLAWELLTGSRMHSTFGFDVCNESIANQILFYIDTVGGLTVKTFDALSETLSVEHCNHLLQGVQMRKAAMVSGGTASDHLQLSKMVLIQSLTRSNAIDVNLITPDFVDFLARCLTFDHRFRITASDAMCHPYMRLFAKASVPDHVIPIFEMQSLKRPEMHPQSDRREVISGLYKILRILRFSESSTIGILTMVDQVFDILPLQLRSQIDEHKMAKWIYAITVCQVGQKVYRDQPYNVKALLVTFDRVLYPTCTQLPLHGPLLDLIIRMIENLECELIKFMLENKINFYSETIYTRRYDAATFQEMVSIISENPDWLRRGDLSFFPTYYTLKYQGDQSARKLKHTIGRNKSNFYFHLVDSKWTRISHVDFELFLKDPAANISVGDLKRC